MQIRDRDWDLTENTPCVQVGAQELAVALQARLGRQAIHVRRRHQLLEEVAQRLCLAVNVDLVLPLKLGRERDLTQGARVALVLRQQLSLKLQVARKPKAVADAGALDRRIRYEKRVQERCVRQ